MAGGEEENCNNHVRTNRSSNIVREIESRRLRWAGYVIRMENDRGATKISTGKIDLGEMGGQYNGS